MVKEAHKKPKQFESKNIKNIETDLIGDKIGRIHVGKQELGKLQTRKLKGLKSRFDQNNNSEEDYESEDIIYDTYGEGFVTAEEINLEEPNIKKQKL